MADRLHKTVSELEREMTLTEFIEWSVFVKLEDERSKGRGDGGSTAKNRLNR